MLFNLFPLKKNIISKTTNNISISMPTYYDMKTPIKNIEDDYAGN